MSEQEHALIERYLRHQLSEAEQQAFEARMAADEAFRQEVLLHERAMAALNFQGLSNLKKKLQQREETHTLQKKKRQRRFWGLLLLLSLGLVLVIIYWCWVKIGATPRSEPAIQKTPTDQPKPKPQKSLPPNTLPEKQSTTAPKTPPIAQRKVNNDALFAVAFQPYRDASLNPNVRDEQNPSPFEQFLQQYWEKQYLPALQAFEKLAAELQNNDDALFLKANALLATGQTAAATALFEGIISRKTARFVQQADWYLALCFVKNGDLLRAKKALQAIAAQLDHPQREDALTLLKKF